MGDTYHEGEIRVQELAGERDEALHNGRLIGERIIAPAFRFLSLLRYFVLGQASAEHECEGTVLFGPPGFLAADADGKMLTVALDPRRDRRTDPVLASLTLGRRVGGLAIDLATRRRLRINGHVAALADDSLVVAVDESYPNCPKYIQKRSVEIDEEVAPAGQGAVFGTELGEAQRALVRRADTCFVVTVHPQGHADASHRGGLPGFVTIDDDGMLSIPDYPGNGMFNTLGNVATNPAAALVFWDFEHHRLLHLSGTAALRFGAPDPDGRTGGTGRFWTFRVRHVQEQAVAPPFRMRFVEASPFNPRGT